MSALINQKQIAALAGVSQTVVSRVLSGRAKEIGIANETIERVEAIAERFNYRPNIGANIIQGRKTYLLGVFLRAFDDPMLIGLLAELRNQAALLGYSLIVDGFAHGQYSKKELQTIEAYRPDAYLLLGDMDLNVWPLHFFSAGKTIINITETARATAPQVRSIGPDDSHGCRLILEHLHAHGHRHIGLLSDNTPGNQQRLQSFRKAMRAFGLPARPSWIFSSDYPAIAAGVDAARYYCAASARDDLPTAFCAMDDVIALSASREFLAAGIKVPSALSITGFNDITAAQLAYPALTTVAQPMAELVKRALQFLDTDIDTSVEHAPIAPTLKVRESTACARTNIPARVTPIDHASTNA